MPKVDLKLHSTDSGNGAKITSSVTYINPNVGNSVLRNFAQQLNSLTTNSYAGADKVETTNLDTESDIMNRNLTIKNASIGGTATISFNIEMDEEKSPAVFYYVSNNDVRLLSATRQSSEDDEIAIFTVTIPSTRGTVYIGLTATETFTSDFIKVDL